MPLYWRRVVRRGEHGARGVEARRRRSRRGRSSQAEVDDVEALARDALGERADELDAGGPHVAADEDPVPCAVGSSATKRAKAAPIALDELGVELVGHGAPDVVGLEDRA